jgi:DNA mismatch endonuclease, patch repair protein
LDKFDTVTRSRVMSRNKSRGAKSTERRLRSILVRAAIVGWNLGHDSGLPGRPDFIFLGDQVAVFVDGCFWHGCRRCRSIPISNRPFWLEKIETNRSRDRRNVRKLRSMGWNVVRIWEHELNSNRIRILDKIIAARMH